MGDWESGGLGKEVTGGEKEGEIWSVCKINKKAN